MLLFKTLKQWFVLKAYLNRQTRGKNETPPADPLPSSLVWMIFRLSYRNKASSSRSKVRIEKYFHDHFDQAHKLFNRLLSYDWLKIRYVALDGMLLLGNRAAQPETGEDFREKTIEIFIEMTRHPDFIVRQTALKGLRPISESHPPSSAILSAAADLLSDGTFYVAEDARDFLLAQGEFGVKWFLKTLRNGNPDGRVITMRALADLSKKEPSRITPNVLNSVAALIDSEDSGISYFAAVHTLTLMDTVQFDTSGIKEILPLGFERALPGFLQQLNNEEAWWRAKVAKNIARFFSYAPVMLKPLIEALSSDKKYIQEGVARTFEAIGEKARDALTPLRKILEGEYHDIILFRAAAAYEAISCNEIPEILIPTVRHSFHDVFFKIQNKNDVPTAVRFSFNRPLCGKLVKSADQYCLGLPHDHGIVSTDKLLDDHAWIDLEGLETEIKEKLINKEVELTGIYRSHTLYVEAIALRGELKPD